MQLLRIIRILCIVCVALTVAPACSQTALRSSVIQTINGKKYYIHKVEKGQSMYAIAKLYETDVNAIVLENPEAIDGIKQGQELKIPYAKEQKTGVPGSDLEKYQVHKVVKGETAFAICKKYAITEKSFYEWNPEAKTGIREGQLVKVGLKQTELATASPVTFETYTVGKGETVYAITKKFNVGIDDFYNLNPETRSGVNEGQVVKIRKKEGSTVSPATGITTTTITVTDTVVRPKKEAYKIGLFLPFEFNETELINTEQLIKERKEFPEMQTIAIDFYEGIKYAMDSLQDKGAHYSLELYDTQDKDSMQVDKLLKQQSLTDIDLLIGPMFNSTFKVVSEKAKEKQIPIVSPVTQQNKILFNNPYTSKTTPSNITLLETLAEFVADSFRTQNIVIVNSGNQRKDVPKDAYALALKELANIKILKTHYAEYLSLTYNNTTDTLKEVKTLAEAKAAYNHNKKNYYILLSEDEVFLTDMLTQLNSFIDKKKELTVIGMKKWVSIDYIDTEYLNKFHFTFAAANFINYAKPEVSLAAKAYREKYYIDPSDFYFQGIDIGLYYLDALRQNGPDFYKTLDKNRKKGMIMDFNFFRPSETTGFDNRSMQVIRYNDYTFSKAN